MLQGDTITRRIAVDPEFIAAVPEIKALLANPDWRGLNRYVGSFDQEPLTYVQTILSHVRNAKPDPQTDLHIDTFHPTVKAFYFLTDVAEDEGPFVYVPGSHRLTPKRLQWEYEQSIGAATSGDTARRRAARSAPPPPRSRRWALRRRAPSRCRPIRWSSPTRSAFTPAASPSARRCGSRSGPTGAGTRSCRGPGSISFSLPGHRRAAHPVRLAGARSARRKRDCCGQPWKDVGRLRPQDPPGRRAA